MPEEEDNTGNRKDDSKAEAARDNLLKLLRLLAREVASGLLGKAGNENSCRQ